MFQQKIIDKYKFKNLRKKVLKNKKIVLCHGVFDLLHYGHILHFKEAKKKGDILIVSITDDKYVNKGPGRPHFTSEHRLASIASLECVDYVYLNKNLDAIATIKLIKPQFYAKGQDYKDHSDDITKKIKLEIKELKKNKGKIFYTNELTFSSSNLINKNFEGDLHKKSLLETISQKFDFIKIKEKIDRFGELDVLVIGETIIDEYIFCETIGKSGKEPVLVLKDLNTEKYLGGSLAIANHLSEFCRSVTLLSIIGEKKEHEKFILNNLNKNIKTVFLNKKKSPTIIKKRYVDHIDKNKILGVYSMNDDPLDKKQEILLKQQIKKLSKKNHLVVTSDYSHGFISANNAKIISQLKKFTSVNAQLNSSNLGFHTLQNYRKINSVIINESEIRHEMRNKHDKIEVLMKKLSIKLKMKVLIVTKGKDGAILYDQKNKKFYYSPAFAKKITDKIGAGDSMLSLISPALFLGYDFHLVMLLGSLAASFSVQSIGNKRNMNKIDFLKALKHIIA